MKRWLALFCIVLSISCKKTEEIGTPAEFTVIASSMADFQAGNTVNFFDVNLVATPLTQPAAGDNIIYDFTGLTAKGDLALTFSAIDTSQLFISSSYKIAGIDTFGTGPAATPVNVANYISMKGDGWGVVGKTHPIVTLNYPDSGTITYPAQRVVYSSPLYFTRFPLYYRDSLPQSVVTATDSFRVNAPALNLVDSAGAQLTTYKYNLNATGRGKIKLKGYGGTLDVIVVKHIESVKSNYILGGIRTDTSFLRTFGLADSSEKRHVYYDFYTRVKGFMGRIEMNENETAATKAYFRKNF